MKALRLFGPNDIRLVDIPVPEINDDEVLVKTKAAAICGSDIRMWENGYRGVDETHPLTLGHEFAGAIEKVGKNVVYYQPGMMVSLQPNIGCGICDQCVSGNFHLCSDYKAFGINMNGAFAEYVRIPSNAVVRGNLALIPDGISCEAAAVIEPLSCAYNGFLKCNVSLGEHALVIGAGPVGIMHAKLLHMAGAVVAMNDISEERLELCKKVAPFIVPYGGDDLAGFVREFTSGLGLDVAITACPVPEVQSSVLLLMNFGGRVNFFGGIPENRQPVSINTNNIHYRELCLTGSTRSSIAQYRKTLKFVADGLLNVESIITNRYSIGDIIASFENVRSAKGIKHVITFT